jgi:putative transposase
VARKSRIQYPGALYHIINRGNYRRDVFATVGAAQAFERVMDEACRRFAWRLHAYVIMRNHFHFGLETPQPNLTEGMHWLQSTFAIRFNRFRQERGHLFQGRYDAILLEDDAILARVVHYIHLNPVRAHIVEPAGCATFRWSSLRYLRQPLRPPWLSSDALRGVLAFRDSPEGWKEYEQFLAELGSHPR